MGGAPPVSRAGFTSVAPDVEMNRLQTLTTAKGASAPRFLPAALGLFLTSSCAQLNQLGFNQPDVTLIQQPSVRFVGATAVRANRGAADYPGGFDVARTGAEAPLLADS
ncbi:MAG TPA: hypothetical protein VGD55_12100 [Acidothermaceae bacterium]